MAGCSKGSGCVGSWYYIRFVVLRGCWHTVPVQGWSQTSLVAVLEATRLCVQVLRWQEQDDSLTVMIICSHVLCSLRCSLMSGSTPRAVVIRAVIPDSFQPVPRMSARACFFSEYGEATLSNYTRLVSSVREACSCVRELFLGVDLFCRLLR